MNLENRERRQMRVWQFFKWLVLLLIVFMVLAYFGIGLVAANTLTKPKRRFDQTNNPGVYDLAYERVSIPTSDGDARVAGWFISNVGSSRVILMVHGNNASRTWEFDEEFPRLGAALQEIGFNILMIDLRGHGESSNARVSFGLKERFDVVGAVDWLLERGFKPGSIGVLGISMGSASSIGGVVESPAVGALAIESAFAEILPLIQNEWGTTSGLPDMFLTPTRMMIRLLYGYDIADSRPVDEIGLIERPILIIHCETDQTVPFKHAQRLAEAAPWASTWYLNDCKHARAYNMGMDAYENVVTLFFDEHLE